MGFLSKLILKENVSFSIFQQIPKALSFGRSPERFLSFTPSFLFSSGIVASASLLFDINLVRLKPPDYTR